MGDFKHAAAGLCPSAATRGRRVIQESSTRPERSGPRGKKPHGSAKKQYFVILSGTKSRELGTEWSRRICKRVECVF